MCTHTPNVHECTTTDRVHISEPVEALTHTCLFALSLTLRVALLDTHTRTIQNPHFLHTQALPVKENKKKQSKYTQDAEVQTLSLYEQTGGLRPQMAAYMY